jgi:hypothetical protein
MKKIILLTLFLVIAVFVMPAYSDPSSSPFEILNEKVDTIQQTLDNEVVPRLDGTSLRIPISELPYTISEPGSYYVTGDLTTTSDGIIVNADNVTIDLNGFCLTDTVVGPS